MIGKRAWSGALLALALVLQLSPYGGAAPGGAEWTGVRERGEYRQFAPTEVELTLSQGIYTNDSFTLPIPANATVLSATLNITGRYVTEPLETRGCGFNQNGSGHRAYKGATDGFNPGATRPAQLMLTEFTASEYFSVSISDDDWAVTGGDPWGTEDGFHLFRFRVPVDVSTEVSVQWEGHASDWWDNAWNFGVFIWNNGSGLWQSVGGGTYAQDVLASNTFHGPGYVADRWVHVLAICTDGNWIMTDFVSVVVKGYPQTYPADPRLDVGGDGTIEWSLTEPKFNYTVTFSEPSLAQQLQEHARNAPGQFAHVPLRFSSNTTGRVSVSDVLVTYRAPPWCGQIPEYTMDEDSTAIALIDLNSFFRDDEAQNLSYEVVYQEDAKKLRADLSPDGHSLDFRTPTRNWWGTMGFRVRGVDGDGLSFECPTFRVAVLPVNDPPQLFPIGNQTARQGELFRLQVRARDVDMELDPTETITFSDGTGLFDIDPMTGLIEFTPGQQHVGLHEVPLTVMDSLGATGALNFTLVVEDAQDPPALDPIPDQTIVQDQPFVYEATARDPDLPYGDSLTFSDDTPLFDIDPERGTIKWTPTKEHIGTHRINITVRDERGGSDRKGFGLTILNTLGTLNRYPSLEPIPDQTAYEGQAFVYTVAATDPDLELGDKLTFSDSSPLFKIGPSNGTISFVPSRQSVGVHNITITVRDRENLADTTSFRLTIVRANSPPNITSVKPRSGTRVLVNRDVHFSAEASDPDLDALNFTWLQAERVLGHGPELVVRFEETGGFIITLVVSDGREEARTELSLEVVRSLPGGGGGLPGPGAAAALASLGLAALYLGRRAKRH